jgi:hypothetical protein
MNRFVRVPIAFLLVLIVFRGSPGAAQQVDPIQDILREGHDRFERFRFHEADSLANVALSYPGLRRRDRSDALILAATSRYPRDVTAQHRDSALAALRQFVRYAPVASLPETMSWPGLDSLLLMARQSTFGASAAAPDSIVLHGIRDSVSIDVVATRPAKFGLWIAHASDRGLGEQVDTTGAIIQGRLRFAPVQTDQPKYAEGKYRLTVVALDQASGDRIDAFYSADFTTPPVAVASLQQAVDPKDLLPEHAAPSREKSILSGLFIGAFTYASAHLLRGSALKNSGMSPDTRAGGFAIGLGIATSGLSWYLDHGQIKIPNVEYNRKIRVQFAEHQRALRAANDSARANYRGVVRLTVAD